MTAADFSSNRDNFCYRHPDRVSFVMCQRCLRTICPECQTQGAVGVVCPECMKEQQAGRTSAQKRAERRWRGGTTSAVSAVRTGSPVTFAIIAITIVAFVIAQIPNLMIGNYSVTQWLLFNPLALEQPWRLFTVALTHAGILHIALNMLSLFMVGRVLEPLIGSGKFLVLYLIAVVGGDAAVALLAPTTSVVGASGAIFGIFGAYIVIARRMGADVTSMLVVLGINLVYGFLPGTGISWQAHLGGLIAGAIAGLIIFSLRQRSQRALQAVLLVALGIALVAVSYIPYLTYIAPLSR